MNLSRLIFALCQVESGGSPFAQNGDAVGILQLTPVFVAEVNRICRYERFSLEDRWSELESEVMVRVWLADRIKRHPDWGVKELALVYRRGESGLCLVTREDEDYAERVWNLYKEGG